MNRATTLLRQRRHIALAITSAVAALSFSPQAFAAGVTTAAGTYVGFSRGCDVLYTAGSGSLQIINGSNNVPCPPPAIPRTSAPTG